MWKGPCADVEASYGNPLVRRLHRRAGEQGIAYNISHDGKSAHVYRMVRRSDGTYSLPPLGDVRGGDTINTFINAALEYTEHDSELYSICATLAAERRESLLREIEQTMKKLTGIADVLADALVQGKRCVRA